MIGADRTVAELSERIANHDPSVSRRQAILIVDEEERLQGIISRGDIVRALQQDASGSMTVSAAGSGKVVVTFPEESLHSAVGKMLRQGIGRLPVVDPQERTRILGYVGRSDVLEARLRAHEEEEQREKGGWWGAAGEMKRAGQT